MNTATSRIRLVIFLLSVAAGLGVLSLRWVSAIEATDSIPGTAQTSGCEEESWLALWNYLHKEPVFRRATDSPFNFAYFNWGFYELYGTILDLAQANSQPTRIISIGRSITVLFGVIGAGLWIGVLKRITQGESIWSLLPWASFPFLGPVTGWMLVSTRPDVGAITFDAIALGLVILSRPRNRCLGLLLAGLAGYLAWSFKISQVGGLCTIGFFLIWRKEWQNLVIFCVPVFIAMLLTLWIGGDTYRHAILGSSFGQSPFHASNVSGAMKHFILTASPFFIGIGVALYWPSHVASNAPDQNRNNTVIADALVVGIIGSVFVTAVMALATSKSGSWTYYYMPATLPLSLLGVTLAYRRKVFIPAASTTAILILVLQTGLLLGWKGKTSIAESSEELQSRWTIYSKLPEPRFSSDLRLNLPWLNPRSPPLVLAFDYHTLRAIDISFEGDGLGGLIERETLKGLLLPSSTNISYDGASLRNYDRTEPLPGWSAFVLKSE